MNELANPSRRQFLKGTAAAAGALVIGVYLPSNPRLAAAAEAVEMPFKPNAFVRIGEDNRITVLVKHAEMGQGVATSLPQMVAEELDVAWEHVGFEFAPAEPVYSHTAFGIQMTGGSTSVSNSYTQMRNAGATARAMLVQAAAEQWGVAPSACHTEQGKVIGPEGQTAMYGELAAKAARLTAPEKVALKAASAFHTIGKPKPRLDTPPKVDGTAQFGIDVIVPEMLIAVIARPPMFGGTLKSVNADKAKQVDGVREVVTIPAGVAVVADSFWQAKKGRDALELEWDAQGNENLSSADILQGYHEQAKTPGMVARQEGAAEEYLSKTAQQFSAEYEFPYLAHAPMEPLNCVASVTADSCEVWTGSQFQTVDKGNAAKIAGLPPEQVTIHSQYLGGGFGRRANKDSDFVSEAVHVAKAVGQPVKVIWTREDDVQGGYYRPAYVHHVTAGVDDNGDPLAWHHRIVGQSIVANSPFESALMHDGVDQTSVEGASTLVYAVPNLQVEYHQTTNPVTTLWWRSVGHTHTAFVAESVIDELAALAKADPVAYRLKALAASSQTTDAERLQGVLKLATEQAGWSAPLAQKDGVRRGRGVAVHKSFGSYAAEVAEVSVKPDGTFTVDKVVSAIDCGTVVNPDTVKAQMESAIVYGLTAVLYGEITIKNGRAQQSNFHDYQALRLDEMPELEAHIVASTADPSGVGEPGTPPIGPAVCNALYAATGQRIRRLPVDTELLKMA